MTIVDTYCKIHEIEKNPAAIRRWLCTHDVHDVTQQFARILFRRYLDVLSDQQRQLPY